MNADVLSAYLGHFCSFAVLMVIVCPRTLSNLGKCNYQGIQTKGTLDSAMLVQPIPHGSAITKVQIHPGLCLISGTA